MFGAVVAARRSAGLEVALTRRCIAFIGMPKSEPALHSKTCFLLGLLSCQTSVEPLPSAT